MFFVCCSPQVSPHSIPYRLETIKPNELGTEGVKVADRMNQRLKDAATTIQDCSHATHDYYKMKFIRMAVLSVSVLSSYQAFSSSQIDKKQ